MELLRSGCATCWAVSAEAAMLRPSEMRSSTSCTATILGRNAEPGWRYQLVIICPVVNAFVTCLKTDGVASTFASHSAL